jgi:hypothetical protein
MAPFSHFGRETFVCSRLYHVLAQGKKQGALAIGVLMEMMAEAKALNLIARSSAGDQAISCFASRRNGSRCISTRHWTQ